LSGFVTTTGAYQVSNDDPTWPVGPDDAELAAIYADPLA